MRKGAYCLRPCINERRSPEKFTASYFDVIPKDTIPSLTSFLDRESCQTVCLPAPRKARRRLCLRNHTVDAPSGIFTSFEVMGDRRNNVVFSPASNTIWIPLSTNKEVFNGVATMYGPSIKRIKFSVDKVPPALFNDIVKYCTEELRDLEIGFSTAKTETNSAMVNKLVGLLKKVGPKLESLTMRCPSTDENVRSCLIQGVRNCTSIKSLTVLDECPKRFSEFWFSIGKNIGKNIEKLDLSFAGVSEEEWSPLFEEIIDCCPELKDVHFFRRPPVGLEEEYVRFLRKLGKQLLNVHLNGIPSEMLNRVEEECPNLRGRFSFRSGDTLKGLENILGEVFIRVEEHDDLCDISEDLVLAKHLEKLKVRIFGSLTGKLAFDKPMVYLKRLDLSDCINSRELINLLKFTPNLTVLDARIVDKIGDGKNSFDGINLLLPKLEEVRLSERRMDCVENLSEEARVKRKALFGQLLKSFASCEFLRELELYLDGLQMTAGEFRTACMPFRLQKTVVTLYLEDYSFKQQLAGRFTDSRQRTSREFW